MRARYFDDSVSAFRFPFQFSVSSIYNSPNKVGMAVQKSEQARVAGMTASHPYIFHEVTDWLTLSAHALARVTVVVLSVCLSVRTKSASTSI